jgi:hypothetical protein
MQNPIIKIINIHKTGYSFETMLQCFGEYDLFSVYKMCASIQGSTLPSPLPMYPHHPKEHSEVGSSELGKQQVCSFSAGVCLEFLQNVRI